MDYILLIIILLVIIIFIPKVNYSTNKVEIKKLTKQQEDYERFMEMSGQYDDDDDDIKAHRAWHDKVYK